MALFSHSRNEYPHKWLTRDYGTFGPRRPDAQSGKPFTLAKGQTLETPRRRARPQRRRAIRPGRQRYAAYIAGKL